MSIFAFLTNPSRRRFLCGKMSRREPKGKKASDAEVISWKQKKDLADMEEMAVGKPLEELIAWTAMIETMSNEQLKDFVLNRPESLQSVKTGKNAPGKKVHWHSDQALYRSNGSIRYVLTLDACY
ncbi:hypothetical protein MUK42_09027 [Musa troglodytarum]|uniref:Uncharacterized protein n=1 Tax=Musa troglodytarum TaxID=320322 RepID=A0A9E7JBW4_9LILI|nr:hypothetical protein MUK42_09027 [Musa troglodytarum]